MNDIKYYILNLIGCRTSIGYIEHLFMIKALRRVGIEVTYINIIKAMHDKLTANIIFNSDNLKPLYLGL